MTKYFLLTSILSSLYFGNLYSKSISADSLHIEHKPPYDSLRNSHRMPIVPQKAKSKKDSLLKEYITQPVVVTGTRNEVLQKDSPVRVSIADGSQAQGTAMVTVADMLREQTGVLLQNNVRTGVQIMGLNPDYTLILIDGQPMIGRVAGVLDLSRVSVGAIERVEIVKGPMSSLYGSDALAGVINIITKKPALGWSGRVYSQYLAKGPSEIQTEGGYGSEKIDISAYLNAKRATPFELTQNVQNRTVVSPYAGFVDYTGQLKSKWYVSDHVSIMADARLFHSESQGKFVESFFGQVAQNEGAVIQDERSATMSTEWSHGKARLTAQLYGSAYTERYEFDTVQGNNSQTDDLLRRIARGYVQYDVLWNLKNRFTFGTEYHVDDIGGARYPDKPFFSTFSGFMQWEGNPVDWISYSLSSRYVKNSAFENPSLSDSTLLHLLWLTNPKLALNVKIGDDIRVRASIGTGFKVPDFRQLYVQFTNNLSGAGYQLIGARRIGSNLRPERSVSYETGISWDRNYLNIVENTILTFGFDMQYFRNDLTDLIDFVQVGNVGDQALYSYRNIKRARTQGIESNIKSGLFLPSNKNITFSAGYQYLIADDLDILEIFEKRLTYLSTNGEEIQLNPKDYGGLWFRSAHSGVLRLQYTHGTELTDGWSANLRAQFIGRFGDQQKNVNGAFPFAPSGSSISIAVLDNENEYADGYTLLNSSAYYRFVFENSWLASLTLTAGINNILNAIDLVSVPGLVGHQIFANITVKF
ncbi:MAG TPA: TonB-dependent receptor [Candidatus Kapabacteria bacterium]|jgi:outer membrane receptor for ferrienterochelin and colicins|nr:TonB-dependent receptor [Candidatus Kapabacteria bacterium]